MTDRVLSFPGRQTSQKEARSAAEKLMSIPISERRGHSSVLQLDDPETLLEVCSVLRERLDAEPLRVRSEATFFYEHISEPRRSIGIFDEREYFLGETALLAGSSCRALAQRDEARRWFDRAECNFRLTVNAVAECSRVFYQRLALRTEERQFEEVRELLPILTTTFRKLEMYEDALKCDYLAGIVLLEMGELNEAAESFEGTCREAEKTGNEKLVAAAYVNLIQVSAMLGKAEETLRYSSEVMPILERQGHREYLAKVHWGLGNLLREKGRLTEAIEALRNAQREFSLGGMMADVAAVQLVIGDLYLDLDQESLALREILAALPVIDEYKLVPEGVAALSLLRESVRQQRINRQALRELHGYFEDLQ